jgi:hypothetical protein
MNHWMFNCKEVTTMVSESMDRRLPFFQRMGIRLHLFMCRFCSRFRRQLLLLTKISQVQGTYLAQLEPSGALSPEARSRIKQAMRQQ